MKEAREEKASSVSERSPAELKRANGAKGEEEGTERWSVNKKTQVVLRLLRGEDLETVSREHGVTVAELAEWREDFLGGGREGLKTRPGDPLERKLAEALAKVGELTMKLELWEKRGSRLGVSRRSDV